MLDYVLTTDPADVPAIAVRRDLEARGREIDPERISPLVDARDQLHRLQRRHGDTGPIGRLRLRDQLADAASACNTPGLPRHRRRGRPPTRVALGQAVDHREGCGTPTSSNRSGSASTTSNTEPRVDVAPNWGSGCELAASPMA